MNKPVPAAKPTAPAAGKPAATAAKPAAPGAPKKKLSLDVGDVSEVLERKISP